MTRKDMWDKMGILDSKGYLQDKSSQIAPESQETAPEVPPLRSHAVTQASKDITERMLRLELHRSITDLGPQKTAQIVAQTFRLKGLPKELRRHL